MAKIVSRYYHTIQTVEEYIRLAKDVNGRSLINELKKYLHQDTTLLELGSGPGTDWNILRNHYKITGSDNSTVFLDHLRGKYPDGQFIYLDAVSLETAKTFDAIYSNKVLHHLQDSELKQSIQRQFAILEPEGIICHSFWRGQGTEVYNGLYVNYQDETSLNQLFSTRFDILLQKSYTEFEMDDSLLLVARKR